MAKACKKYGLIRVQRSVFLGQLESNRFDELSEKCLSLIDEEKDSVKTSLICETIRKLRKTRMIYADLLEVKSSDDFVKRIVTAIIAMENSAGFSDKIFRMKMNIGL